VGPAALLATSCTPNAAHGGAGTACGGLEPTAGGSNRGSPSAGFPELPYGSRCLEFELRAEPGVESSGRLCHPSNVPAKQGSAARRNTIPTGPARAQQPRSEPRGSSWTPRPASNSPSAFLLLCLPDGSLPAGWKAGSCGDGLHGHGCATAAGPGCVVAPPAARDSGGGWQHPGTGRRRAATPGSWL